MTIVVRDRRKESSEEDTTVKLRTSTKLARSSAPTPTGWACLLILLRFLYKGGDVYGDETAGAIGLAEGACFECVDGDPLEEAEEARHRHGGPLGRVAGRHRALGARVGRAHRRAGIRCEARHNFARRR